MIEKTTKKYLVEKKLTRLSSSLKKTINKELGKLLDKQYFTKIPLNDVFGILKKNGIVALQEDNTEWSGFLTGGTKKTEQVYFDLGFLESPLPNNRYEVIKNAMLAFSYYQMPSGKWEIIAYIT